MKKTLMVFMVFGSVSIFAADCEQEIKNFNDAMVRLRSHADGAVTYVNEVADYVENSGYVFNRNAGRKYGSNDGAGLVNSAIVIRSNANTIELTGKQFRNSVTAAAQAMYNCASSAQ